MRRVKDLTAATKLLSERSLWDCIGDAAHFVFRLCNKHDYWSLSLVSKTWHHEVEPYLYSTFRFEEKEEGSDYPHLCRLMKYMRSTLNRPELGRYVRHLNLLSETLWDEEFELLIHFTDLDYDVASRVIDAATPLPASLKDNWKAGLEKRSADAIVVLLITQLPNLRHLQVGGFFAMQTTILGAYLRTAIGCVDDPEIYKMSTLRHLQTIEHIQMSYSCRKATGRDPGDVLHFCYLTGLREMAISLDNPIVFEWPFAAAPDLSHIHSMELSFIRETHLHHILAATRHLKMLCWTFYYNSSETHATNQPRIDLDAIGQAIQLVQASLETLKLRGDSGVGPDSDYCPFLKIDGSLRALRCMTKLRDMEAPMVFLAGGWSFNTAVTGLADVLPSGIRSLKLNDSLYPQPLDYRWFQRQNGWFHHGTLMVLQEWSLVWQTDFTDLAAIAIVESVLPSNAEDFLALERAHKVKMLLKLIEDSSDFD